jgi:hypothetical protein
MHYSIDPHRCRAMGAWLSGIGDHVAQSAAA